MQHSLGGCCAQPTLRALGVRLPLLREKYYLELFIWMVCLFSVDLFSHLYVSEWTYGYLFCTSYYNTVLLGLFFVHIIPTLAIGSSFSWLLCPFSCFHYHECRCFICVLSIFFFSGAVRYSRFILYIFPFLFLESSISPRNPSFHLLENDTRNQALGIRFTCYY